MLEANYYKSKVFYLIDRLQVSYQEYQCFYKYTRTKQENRLASFRRNLTCTRFN